MERLTKCVNGVVCYTKGKYENTLACELEDSEMRAVLYKLAEYEDTELTPGEVIRLNDFTQSQIGVLLRELARERKKTEWHKAEVPPDSDRYILLSFANYSCPLIGHYESCERGGNYYLGDCTEEDTCLKNDLYVNAWMELPESYKEV